MKTRSFNQDGAQYITALISEAVENGTRTATVSGSFIIDEAIRIPSNFTLILENCYLMQKKGSFSNIFVNEHHGTEIGRTTEGTDTNISIIGRGEAVLDGGEYNGLSEKTQLKDGMPPIWKNNLVLFTNVDGFKVSGISCKNQRWWSLNFIYCRNGYIGNIDFCANDTGIDENGNIYHGLKRDKYSEVLVKNADGIDLRQGCHDITIENITGFTEDDTIALTNLNGSLEQTFSVDGLCSDICNVSIKNVESAAFCAIVRLLNQGDLKLHDITIDGITDTAPTSPHLDSNACAVRIGDTHMYGKRHATKEETYNITVKNVCASGRQAISLAGDMQNVVIYGIECKNGCQMLLDMRQK